MINRIKTHIHTLVYRLTPPCIYGRNRTRKTKVVRWLDEYHLYSNDITAHLKKNHPRKWYDDEVNALFFIVWDYLTKVRKLDVSFKYDPAYDEKVLRINGGFCGFYFYDIYENEAECLLDLYRYHRSCHENIRD